MMIKEAVIPCKYVGSKIRYGVKINKTFNDCSLDNNWKLKHKNFDSTIKYYQALNDDAKAVLQIYNHPKNDVLCFKKNSTIKISDRVLQYSEKNLTGHFC